MCKIGYILSVAMEINGNSKIYEIKYIVDFVLFQIEISGWA